MSERTETASKVPAPEGESVLLSVVRELLRTPGFKEMVLSHLREVDPQDARELVRTVIWEDVGFSMGVLGASPKLVNSAAAALLELALQLKSFTGEILRQFLRQLISELDQDTIKALPQAWASLLEEVLLEDPAALDSLIAALGGLAESILRGAGSAVRLAAVRADMGRIRQGVTDHFERRREVLSLDAGIYDPVIVSNLLGMVPPFLNYLLRALARLLRRLDLPPEILAHAVFQLLEDVDRREVAHLVNAFSDFVNSLHRGNLLLGGEEPRFKEVLRGISRDLVELVDGERLKKALIALGEDGKVISEVVSEHLFATPERTAALGRVLGSALLKGLGIATSMADRLARLTPEALEELIPSSLRASYPEELARLFNSCSLLLRRLWELPSQETATPSRFLAALDRQEMVRTLKGVLFRVSGTDGPRTTLETQEGLPEILARTINRGLRSLNDLLESRKPEVQDALARFSAELDKRELRRAAGGLIYLALPGGRQGARALDVRNALPLALGLVGLSLIMRRRRRRRRQRLSAS